MTITKTFLALAVSGLLFTGCKDSASAPESVSAAKEVTASNSATGKMETASFNIEGMTCAMGCARTIEKKLAGLEGVKKVSVDYEKKHATVNFDSAKISPETLVETVEAASDGKTYKVTNLKSSGDQAMNIDPEKPKKKKKAKKGDKKAAKEKGDCAPETKAEGKAGCCASKKSCHGEAKAGTL